MMRVGIKPCVCVEMITVLICMFMSVLFTYSKAAGKIGFQVALNLSDFSSKHQGFIVSPGLKADKLG